MARNISSKTILAALCLVFVDMKARNVKFRLNRDRLVVGDHVLRSGSAAYAFLQQQLS